MDAWVEGLRRLELEAVRRHLPPGGRLLEVGAGAGWQARELARLGFEVTAVDLADSPLRARRVFPVVDYDGRRLPFPDGAFAAVFSSNVLEHVPHLEALLAEMARVLAPGGVMVHVLPSASWRLWTTLTWPLALLRGALRRVFRTRHAHGAPGAEPPTKEPPPARPRRAGLARLLPERHGEVGNVLSETWHFSAAAWRRRFARSGLVVRYEGGTGLLYTGNELLGRRGPLGLRRLAARLCGSTCHVWTLRKGDVAASSDGEGPEPPSLVPRASKRDPLRHGHP